MNLKKDLVIICIFKAIVMINCLKPYLLIEQNNFTKIVSKISSSLVCTKGFYGDSCSHHCAGQCRDYTTCNHVTGHCAGGCSAGWKGISCEKGIF